MSGVLKLNALLPRNLSIKQTGELVETSMGMFYTFVALIDFGASVEVAMVTDLSRARLQGRRRTRTDGWDGESTLRRQRWWAHKH